MTTKNVSQPEYDVRIHRNVLIPMPDGITLSALAYVPDTEGGSFPAIIGYYSCYPKEGYVSPGSAWHDQGVYFAKRGYHVYFIDVRGTGGSEGRTSRPYSEQEIQDGHDVVEWLAQQPWCNGNVGMMGMSYGGYTTYLVAATAPPHLKAIIPFSGGVDWYDAGWGYEGGNLGGFHFCGYWCAHMLALNAAPPAYQDPEGRWLNVWKQHLEEDVPYLFDWMENAVDGPYYHEASVCSRYDEIKAPALVINGWHDFYPTEPLLFYENIKSPKRLIAGPWEHAMPDRARPGPRIDFFHEQLRWMDHWLKGKETGVMDDPPVKLFVAEHTPIEEMRLNTANQRGKWRAEETYPPQGTTCTPWYLGEDGILDPSAPTYDEAKDGIRYNPTAGVSNNPCYIRASMGLEQRGEDDASLVYATPPLDCDLEVTGQPRVVLHVSSSTDIAAFAARLCDEAPDGTVQLVSRRALNVTHRESHSEPTPLKPGKVYAIAIDLNATSYVFKKGHRMRLYIACADFPYLWPTPKPADNVVHRGTVYPSRIELPVVPERGSPTIELPPSSYDMGPTKRIDPNWRVLRDETSTTVEWGNLGWRVTMTAEDADDPARMVLDAVRRTSHTTTKGTIDVEGRIRIRSDETTFNTSIDLNIMWAGEEHFRKEWKLEYPRGLR